MLLSYRDFSDLSFSISLREEIEDEPELIENITCFKELLRDLKQTEHAGIKKLKLYILMQFYEIL